MRCPSVAALLAVASLAVRPAVATVVVPWSEREMVAVADDVLTGVVERVETVATDAGAVESRATVAVDGVVKGRRDTRRVVLRQPGGTLGDLTVVVLGTTALGPGDAVLLFGRRARDGGHRPIATGLGVYRTSAALPPLATAARSVLGGPAVHTSEFTFLGAPPASRWFEFDGGRTVALHTANGDADLGRARSDALARRAVAAWNDVRSASVRLALGPDAPDGPSVAGGVCNGRSVVQFDDPADELPDLGNCAGVLAVGGFCARGTALGPGGEAFNVIAEGDITVNRRVASCFSETSLAEILTHEVGHVLGLGHSSENASEPNATLRDATMYFLAHLDGRGAAVRADDVAGIGVLYPPDDDGDGIPDEFDACPSTPARQPIDETGCACADAGHVACTGGDTCHEAGCDVDTARCVVTPVDCTGDEPCLAGMCTEASGCSTTPVTGFDAVGCALLRDFSPAECAGDRVPGAIGRAVRRARTLVGRAVSAALDRQERLLERAERQLARAVTRLERAADLAGRRPLAPACAERLRLLVGDAQVRVESRGAASLFEPAPG